MATAVAALAIVVTASDASAQRWGRGFGVGFRGPGISRIGWGGGVSRVWGGRPGIGWGVRRVGWGGWGVRRVGWAGYYRRPLLRAAAIGAAAYGAGSYYGSYYPSAGSYYGSNYYPGYGCTCPSYGYGGWSW
jgi:hypothetical protein